MLASFVPSGVFEEYIKYYLRYNKENKMGDMHGGKGGGEKYYTLLVRKPKGKDHFAK